MRTIRDEMARAVRDEMCSCNFAEVCPSCGTASRVCAAVVARRLREVEHWHELRALLAELEQDHAP